MKKYFFLLFLLAIYIFIQISDKTKPVYLPDDFNDFAVENVMLNFDNGINCYDLRNVFLKYSKDYYINNITLNKKSYDVTCDDYELCLEQIFLSNDESFYNKYIVEGFAIKNIDVIAYKDDIIPFLNQLNINYEVKNMDI